MTLPYKYHLRIQSFCIIPAHISMDASLYAISFLSISEMIGLSLCSSFDKWRLQSSVGCSAYPITTYLPLFIYFSLLFLQCSSASQMKQQNSDSICWSATQPSWTWSQCLSLFSVLYSFALLLLHTKRMGVSISLPFPNCLFISLTHTHTHTHTHIRLSIVDSRRDS